MKTKTLIQSEAKILKITSLKKGDVVKMVEEDDNNIKMTYCIVIDLLNEGSSTYIEFLQYKRNSWSNVIDIENKIYSGTNDLKLFPSSIQELENYFGNLVQKLSNEIKEKEEELSKKKLNLKKVEALISGELSKKLASVSYEEISQEDYDKMKEIEISNGAKLPPLENKID